MRFIAVAVSVAAFALPVAGQYGQLPPLTEQVEVHVVNVDVSVTDRDGKPVTDLTKDDFQVFEDGHLQPITNFSVMHGTAARQVAVAKTAAVVNDDTTRRVLLIIDNNFLGAPDRSRAIDAVEKYLASDFGGEWAVAGVSRTTEMLQPFTSDRKLVLAALEKARKMPSVDTAHAINRSVLSERFIRKGDDIVADDQGEKIAFTAREQTFRNLMAVQNTARAVIDTARGYANASGKKFIVLLTGGIELNTTFLAYEKENEPELRNLRDEIDRVSDAMVQETNAANFTLHVINAKTPGMPAPQADVTNRSSGIVRGTDLLRSSLSDPIDVSDMDTIPRTIALGTGGLYLPSGDLHESLQRIDAVTSNFYSLGYKPEHNGDRRYHTIKVRVQRPNVRVANRNGYFDDTPEDRLQEVLRLRSSFDPGFASLPVQVKVGEASTADRDLVVPVTAAMPLARITVVPQDKNYVGRVHVYLSVFDESGRNIGFEHKEQEVTLAPDQLQRLGDFRYTMKVKLRKGAACTVVMTLRDELSNEIGSASEVVHL